MLANAGFFQDTASGTQYGYSGTASGDRRISRGGGYSYSHYSGGFRNRGCVVGVLRFSIFGYAAASTFPQIFFPNLPPARALVFSYLAYGSGYPARLIGAFLFGHFGDRTGRKIAFLINILIVG